VAAPPASVWLVIPTYDEAENVEALVAAALENLPSRRHLLVVDDNSPDGTGAIADRIAATDSDVEVLHRPSKQGIGPAYVAGFKRALAEGADVIVQMDADFSHSPADLPRLLAALDASDVALGSRYVDGGGVTEWGPLRRAISRGGCAYARGVLGLEVHDLTGGFKAFRRAVLEAIDLDSISTAGYAFQVETTYRAVRAGFRVDEIPITFHDRRVGESKMSSRIIAEAVLRVPAMRLRNRQDPYAGSSRRPRRPA
jgi:dolichol-phosphate mannosyltransferase